MKLYCFTPAASLFYGVCNVFGGLENIYFTPSNVHDNQVLNELLKDINGVFICDSGYLLKEEDLKKFMYLDKEFFIATRKNMKRIMSDEQKKLFRKRSRIETDWSVLRNVLIWFIPELVQY